MSPEEIARLVHIAEDLGIEKLKLTGGEPLLRKDIVDIVARASMKIKDISLTTNGTLLDSMADELKEAGLQRVNVSLDSLDQGTYERITGRNCMSQVVKGIEAAVQAGLNPVKINMVVLKGVNDHEIEGMLNFAQEHEAVLQIIELEAPQELISANFFTRYHEDISALESRLAERAVKQERRAMNHRTKYFLPQEVEVVRPMHNSQFCAHCHRMRITSDGLLKPCLLSPEGVLDILSLLRSGASDAELRDLFTQAIGARKPYWV